MKRIIYLITPVFLLSILISIISCNQQPFETADLILLNASVYTMEEEQPWAAGIAIRGNKIIAVLDNKREGKKYTGDGTRIIDLDGKFVIPGFIDAHTHFSSGGALLQDANLLAVSSEDGLKKEIERVVTNLEEGEWITGGLWGAYEQWGLGSAGKEENTGERWKPDRWMIDDLTPHNPVLLWNYDRTLYLANTPALQLSGVDRHHLSPLTQAPDAAGCRGTQII